MTSRRTVLTAGWVAPTMVVATAAPAVAASQKQSRLRFANTTVTEGKLPNVLYVNTKVLITDGPDPVRDLLLTITLGDETRRWEWDITPGWGSTEQIHTEWHQLAKTNHQVTFTAMATGCAPISATITAHAPGWWA